MGHFKINLETGKKGSCSRILYVRAVDIIHALGISKKIRYSKLRSIVPISYEEYMKGVDKKYAPPPWRTKD